MRNYKISKEFLDELISEAKMQNIFRYVVGAVISKDSKVLLLKRPPEDFMGGIYELPSGKVEKGESLEDALCREVREETGLEVIEIKEYLGHFDYQSKKGEKTRQFNFHVEVSSSTNKITLREHVAYAWVSKEEIESYPITDSVKEILRRYWNLQQFLHEKN